MKRFTLEEKNEVLETPFIHIHRKLDVMPYQNSPGELLNAIIL